MERTSRSMLSVRITPVKTGKALSSWINDWYEDCEDGTDGHLRSLELTDFECNDGSLPVLTC